jgi:acetylglutamate kinase
MLSNNEEQIDSKSGKLDIQNISNENKNPLDSYLLEKTIVIKVGGSTLGFEDTTLSDIVKLKAQGYFPIVVHGGGADISEWMQKIGKRPKFVDGRRVTDKETLNIVISVLAGKVNTEMVNQINILGGKAIGLSGVDDGLITAKITNSAWGYVGEVDKVKSKSIFELVKLGYIPVIAPLCLNAKPNVDDQILNVNADSVAGEVARSIKASKLVFITDVPGVLDISKRVIPKLMSTQVKKLVKNSFISGGMIPKLEACMNSVSEVNEAHIIDGRNEGALFLTVTKSKFNKGTLIVN